MAEEEREDDLFRSTSQPAPSLAPGEELRKELLAFPQFTVFLHPTEHDRRNSLHFWRCFAVYLLTDQFMLEEFGSDLYYLRIEHYTSLTPQENEYYFKRIVAWICQLEKKSSLFHQLITQLTLRIKSYRRRPRFFRFLHDYIRDRKEIDQYNRNGTGITIIIEPPFSKENISF